MNRLLSLSVMPLAATATVASVMMTSPAQAVVIGSVQLAGGVKYVDTATNDYLDMSGFNLAFNGDGVLSGLNGLATLSNIDLGAVNGVDGTYSSSAINPFITFADSTTFTIDNPFDVAIDFLGGGKFEADLKSFSGVFSGPGYTGIANGIFSAQKLSSSGSYSMTFEVEPVPEPLTILGTGIALGFGGLFKSKSSKKQSVKA